MSENRKELKWESAGKIIVLFKDGTSLEAEYIDGGGMMIGDSPGNYEVSVIIDSSDYENGSSVFFQKDIAAVVDTSDWQQVEFGNGFMTADDSDHPRPQLVRV